MKYTFSEKYIEDGSIKLIYGDEEYSGVVKIMDMVSKDISLVLGKKPLVEKYDPNNGSELSMPVICGTVGKSSLINELENKAYLSFDDIKNKREVYKIAVVEGYEGIGKSAIVIAGSDKRGTIYGMFKLSEMLGVSPFVDWLSDMPKKLEVFELDSDYIFVSKEPSVRYRGFFINDEWPAFGNWCNKHFGGFTKECYVHVFELLLRLKGNYLWPAMWSSIFANDGPGLDNAILADELGVVMGMSHHEPCLRHGEEYKYLRGKDSIYGDAWNFRTNEEGITRFWADGLKRNGDLENVITVGMRGEADSTIMGKDATLKDNIELLEDVLKTQNELIRENVCEDLDKVPRMLALYKEVEPFFYGDENTKGLMDNPELEGVTLMLCDDNFGNMRTLPTEHMREHKGGYGMYYHFDYHGWPISFEWVNSSYLPKVWEQMTEAYEFGIRDLWIVNVGDIFTMEYPLAYFLELAYDYDKWGLSNINSAREYTEKFAKKIFGGKISDNKVKEVENLLMDYTKIASARRPEAMNDNIYSPSHYSECEEMIEKCDLIMDRTNMLYDELEGDVSFTFYQLVKYPVLANLNLQKMWLLTSMNHYLTSIKATRALVYADMIEECIEKDTSIVDELHAIADGKWYGMGLSEHVGFTRWNEEECQYPVIYRWKRANKPRIVVTIKGTDQHTEGAFWSGIDLTIKDFLNPAENKAVIRLYSACGMDTKFSCLTDSSCLKLDTENGIIEAMGYQDIVVSLDRTKVSSDKEELVIVKVPDGEVKIHVPVYCLDTNYGENTFILSGDYVSIEAEHYTKNVAYREDKFVKIPEYGKTLSGMKVMPVTNTYNDIENSPYLEYSFVTEKEGEYEVTLYTTPTNPTYRDNKLNVGISLNGENQIISLVPEKFKVSDDNSDWKRGVLDNIRLNTLNVNCTKGLNELRIHALSTGLVLQKIVINPIEVKVPYGYLGPKETFRC